MKGNVTRPVIEDDEIEYTTPKERILFLILGVAGLLWIIYSTSTLSLWHPEFSFATNTEYVPASVSEGVKSVVSASIIPSALYHFAAEFAERVRYERYSKMLANPEKVIYDLLILLD